MQNYNNIRRVHIYYNKNNVNKAKSMTENFFALQCIFCWEFMDTKLYESFTKLTNRVVDRACRSIATEEFCRVLNKEGIEA